MRPRIISAIVHREILEYLGNHQAILLLFMTLGLNFGLYLGVGITNMTLTLNMTLIMLGFMNTMMLFSEEKDHNTLDAVLLTPVNAWELILGKLLVNFSITFASVLFFFLLIHREDAHLLHLVLNAGIGSLIYCLIGMCFGVCVPSQKVASSYGSLSMMVFLLPELFSTINEGFGFLARAMPTFYLNTILRFSKDAPFMELISYYIVVFAFLASILAAIKSFVENLLVQESKSWQMSNGNCLVIILIFSISTFSSLYFKSSSWEEIERQGGAFLYNSDQLVTIPLLDKEKYRKKHIYDYPHSVVMFEQKEANGHYFFIKVRKNWKSETLEQYIEKKVVKWKKAEDIFDLQVENEEEVNSVPRWRVSFRDDEGANEIYYVSYGDWFYHIGIVELNKSKVSQRNLERMNSFFGEVEFEGRSTK